MTKYQVTSDELWMRLRETVGHITRSAAAYDAGDESEARRLANSIRLLVKHQQSGQTKALLQQLGLLDTLLFVDTCGPMIPGNMLPDTPMLKTELNTGTGARFRPRLGEVGGPWGPPRLISFSEWWDMPVIREPRAPVEFSRRELVLSVAEQDGGTHVDPTLNQKYAALTRLNALGWQVSHAGRTYALRPVELAHVRQIAHEVLATLTKVRPAVVAP